ncbi:hypothetical protein ACQJBY_034617 [Aegilops geniculata]
MSNSGGMAKEYPGSGGPVGVMPFVAKTYGMVEDPATDGVIAWGRGGNSFVVADHLVFSGTLLPAHFKHCKFSNFVRQLNTYGFRKVDRNRWEYAHVLFLRGHPHLLHQIVRLRRTNNNGKHKPKEDDHHSNTMVGIEVILLKQEQKVIKDRLAAMSRQVRETERLRKQMLDVLLKVVQDPEKILNFCYVPQHPLLGNNDNEDKGAEVKRLQLQLLDREGEVGDTNSMSVDGPLYDITRDREEVFVPETGIDFTGFYTGGDLVADGGGEDPSYAFPMDNDY